jgi:transcriptional regulator with XRE-family HTH domain
MPNALSSVLKNRRDQLGLTLKQIADYMGVAEATVQRWESGNIKSVRYERIVALAECLRVSPSELMGWEGSDNAPISALIPTISKRASHIGLLYDRASERDRQLVDTVLDPYDDGTINEPEPASKVIPLFGTAAAAGPGEFDTGLPWEDYNVPCDSRAEFAVRISGDSMEPVLHDGQIALCVKRRPEIGDVAVVSVNGSLFVKQFITDGRNIYLRSLNRARRDADVDIWESGSDTVQCYGTVILSHRPALVEE